MDIDVYSVIFLVTIFLVAFTVVSVLPSHILFDESAKKPTPISEGFPKREWSWSSTVSSAVPSDPSRVSSLCLNPATFQGYVTIPAAVLRHPMFVLAFRPSFVTLYTLWEHGGVFTVPTAATIIASSSAGEQWTDPHRGFSAEVTWVTHTEPLEPLAPKRIPIPTMHWLASQPRTPWMSVWIREFTRAMMDYPSIDFYFEDHRALLRQYQAEEWTDDLHKNAVRLAYLVAFRDQHQAQYEMK